MDEQNRLMVDKLDVLIRLTAANVIQGKALKEQVRLLSSVGLKPKEIAEILGKTPNHIRVILATRAKKGKNKKETASEEVAEE